MSKHLVRIGTTDGDPFRINASQLLTTKLLVTANSGGGKSYLLRKLFEQIGPTAQVIVLDLEGEFVTLREKLDMVIVGPTGEIPTDVRSAGLLVRRLMEKELSAVIDLSELKPGDRRAFVRRFCEEMIELPKNLWHPVFIAIDEAHLFCPEKGQGEAESTAAVIDLCTRGRKRGFCSILATQRISKLNKDAAAEHNNKFIGRTTLDVDLKRAAFELGISASQAVEDLRDLKAGEFYGFGPAIELPGVTLMHVDEVETMHPKAGRGQSLTPPKPSSNISAIVSELQDLPKQAEAEIRDLTDAKKQIADLKRQLTSTSKPADNKQLDRHAATARAPLERQNKVLRQALEQLMKVTAKIEAMGFEKTNLDPEEVRKAVEAATSQIVKMADAKMSARATEFERLRSELTKNLASMQKLLEKDIEVGVSVTHQEPFAISSPKRAAVAVASGPPADSATRESLTGPEAKILDSIAFWETIGVPSPVDAAVALKAGYSPSSTGYTNPRGSLRAKGLLEYSGDQRSLTKSGKDVAAYPQSVGTLGDLHQQIKAVLAGPEQRILSVLIESYPKAKSNEDVAPAAGYSATSTGYTNPRGKLRSLGLAEYRDGGVAATAILFPESLQ